MLRKAALAVAFLLAFVTAAAADCGTDVFGAGQVCANTGSGNGNGSPSNVSPLLDQVFGTTQNSLIFRGASAWAAAIVSGDFTIASTGVGTLTSVIAVAGPIGSATLTPVVTFDAKGRLTTVTSVTTAPILSGDGTTSANVLTLATVNANVGTFGSATNCVTVTTNAKGLITAVSAATCAPAFSSITGTISTAQQGGTAGGDLGGTFPNPSVLKVNGVTPRTLLTADTTYFVATTGNDGNAGTSSGSPWLTVQHALDVIESNVDAGGFNITISVADGTYSGTIICSKPATGFKSGNRLNLTGDTATPANAILTSAGTTLTVSNKCQMNVDGFTVTSTGGVGAFITVHGTVTFGDHMVWGAVSGGTNIQIWVSDFGLVTDGSHTVTGGAANHIHADTFGGYFAFSKTVTFSGSPTFSAAIHDATTGGVIETSGMAYSGTVTGTRFSAVQNALITTGNSGSLTYYPGTVAGVVSSGAYYDSWGGGTAGQISYSGGGTGTTPPAWGPGTGQVSVSVAGVNFNVANTDTAISIPLPPGATRYYVRSVVISGASTSLTTATCGVFTATGGGGTAIVTGASGISVSTGADNTNNNMQALTLNNANSQSYNVATLQFRVAAAEGVAATANVTVAYSVLP